MDLAYLNICLPHKVAKRQLLEAFKIVLKNWVHSFGFSQKFPNKNTDYFRYAGPYKPLSY